MYFESFWWIEKNLRTTQVQKEMYSPTISLPREECCPYFSDISILFLHMHMCVFQ